MSNLHAFTKKILFQELAKKKQSISSTKLSTNISYVSNCNYYKVHHAYAGVTC